jgi:UDP-GlcNAc:undecaprenyl-phosphate/decaprenyl-phosphate GlcNAc-1-phosphate transferase
MKLRLDRAFGCRRRIEFQGDELNMIDGGLTGMSFAQILFCILLGFTVCWGLVPLVCKISPHLGSGEREGQFHHTHQQPISRLGGLALAGSFLVVAGAVSLISTDSFLSLQSRLVIVCGALAMFTLGCWDDVKPIGAKIKLLGQIAIATGVYLAGVQIQIVQNPFTHETVGLGAAGYLATVFWLVALTNLINLIDGIDGLAGGISFMLMCLLAHVGSGMGMTFSTLLTGGMAAALLGFIYYNFPPAKIYMGDGGAYFLGFLIGILAIVDSHKGSVAAALIAPLFALTLPILDVTLAILRRGLKGLPIFRPDQKHIHHVLLKFGFSRERAVLILYTFSVASLFLAFGVFWAQGRLLALLCGFLFIMLLVLARSVGLVNNWFSMKNRLSRSLALRVETRYALILSQWLEMESERRSSIHELWEDYQFVVKKLGFSEVRLQMEDGANSWRAPGFNPLADRLHRMNFDVNSCGRLEFAADPQVLPDNLFELLTELAAETWHKAASRWQKLNRLPLRFSTVASPDTSTFQRKQKRPYSPDTAELWIRRRGLKVQST